MQDVSSLEAEIGALRDGLQLALSQEMDALAAICLITGTDQPRHFAW